MMTAIDSISPTQQEVRQARSSKRQLDRVLSKIDSGPRLSPKAKSPRLKISFEMEGENAAEVTLPKSVLRILERLLVEMAAGNAVALTSTEVELTTQQAADMLHVSRPFLAGLLDNGVIPMRKVGTHRRVLLNDLLEYKRTTDAKRHHALDELIEQAQELGMGYE